MAITHAVASGMGGMRAAGDLVARMQISQGMRLVEAKKYVADKLGVAVRDLTDPIIMSEVRNDLGLGTLHAGARSAKGIEAKHNIADILKIDINCVRNFKKIRLQDPCEILLYGKQLLGVPAGTPKFYSKLSMGQTTRINVSIVRP
jgi:hypothetical protein